MEHLLVAVLKRFIRQGSFTVTTASGNTYTFGDGSGPPVAVRFTTAERPTRCHARSRTETRRSLYGRQLRRRTRHDRRRSGILLSAGVVVRRRIGPCHGCCATCCGACSNSIRARAPATMWRTITISTAGCTRCFSTATSNIPAPISRPPISRSTTRSSPRSAISPPSCGWTAGASVLDIGCGWGGLALYLAESAGAHVTGITLSDEHIARAGRAPSTGLPHEADFRLHRLSRRRRALRPHCLGRHVRACRRALLRRLFQQSARASRRRRGRGAAFDRPRSGPSVTNPWIAKYIFPGGYIPALCEVLPPIERRGCSRPISRSSACTMPRRSRYGATASAHRDEAVCAL